MKKVFLVFCFLIFSAANILAQEPGDNYQYKETKDLVSLVKDTANIIEKKGEPVFPEFKKEKSQWRHGSPYIFILDTEGNMILHPYPSLEGKNLIDLQDVNKKFINKEIIATAIGSEKEGWVHYEWLEPGYILPMWKSTFIKLTIAPSGKKYIVCSGLYNMKMEKEFIVKVVDRAAALIEKEGRQVFPQIRDKTGPFAFLDTYVFVDTPSGVELVNGAFPSLEGRNVMDYKDSNGKYMVRDYINIALTKAAGWTDYLWPKPGQSVPSKKLTYVRKAKYGDEIFIVGSGAYLE